MLLVGKTVREDQGQLMEKPQKLPGRRWSMRRYLSSIDRGMKCLEGRKNSQMASAEVA